MLSTPPSHLPAPPRRWLSRPAVLAVLMLTVIVPTLLPRSLHAVAKFSSLSVCMLLVLASSIAGLALVSLARGQIAPDVHVLPTGKHLGKTPFEAANTLLSVVAGGWAGGWVGRKGGC